MEKFKGYKGPYTLGSIQVNASNAIGQNIDAVQNGVESFATFWLWDRKPDERELATMNVMLSGPELLEALIDLKKSIDDYFIHAKSIDKERKLFAKLSLSGYAINKSLGTPTNSTDPLTQSRIMKATEGLNLEEQ